MSSSKTATAEEEEEEEEEEEKHGDKEESDNNPLDEFLSFVESDASLASMLFDNDHNNHQKQKKDSSSQLLLLETCRHLFQHVESLATTLHKLQKDRDDDDDDNNIIPTLSGLNELYLGEQQQHVEVDDDNSSPATAVDVETVWGQVDLQNEALQTILKKSVRKLTKAAANNDGTEDSDAIRILNLESEVLHDDDDEEEEDEEDDDEEEDEVARRMRERMERTLEDMDNDDGEEDDEGEDEDQEEDDEDSDKGEEYEDTRFFGKKKGSSKPQKKQEQSAETNDSGGAKDDLEDLVDPAAEELNNGFFDINEMEAFADEEEDMLPEQVWDPTPEDYDNKAKKKKTKKSFHQRQREGIDNDNDDEDDSDEDEDEEYERMMKSLQNVKRKKYREDDEIEALFSMYKDTTASMQDRHGDDEEMDEAVNMTAADLFGAPNKKYFHKWKAQQQQQQEKEGQKKQQPPEASAAAKRKSNDDDDDADSWDEYKFDEEDADWGGEDDNQEEDQKPKAKAKKDDSSDSSSDDDDGSSSSSSDSSDSSSDSDDDDGDKKPKAKKATSKSTSNKPTTSSKQAKSPYERQSSKLQQETERLEKELIAEKPWQMVGEAAATARPLNSLLEGTPEFSVASKMAPVITPEHTANLEDIIKQRILNEDWDDVIPRELPDVAWATKRGELPEVSQEKAKLGLGELYEREYLKKVVGYDVDAAQRETEEDKAKNEMKQLFANICSKLDALSNYHFAPRPVAPEADIRTATATPAIAMEEVLPLHVSNARGSAPEEVYERKRGRDGILRNETELEQTERKRMRAAKKAARRKARKEKAADNKLIARVQPGLGLNNPYEKRKANEKVSVARAEGRITDGLSDSKSGGYYGSSNKFFRQMQDEVSQALHEHGGQQQSRKETADQQRKQSTARNRKSSTFKM